MGLKIKYKYIEHKKRPMQFISRDRNTLLFLEIQLCINVIFTGKDPINDI